MAQNPNIIWQQTRLLAHHTKKMRTGHFCSVEVCKRIPRVAKSLRWGCNRRKSFTRRMRLAESHDHEDLKSYPSTGSCDSSACGGYCWSWRTEDVVHCYLYTWWRLWRPIPKKAFREVCRTRPFGQSNSSIHERFVHHVLVAMQKLEWSMKLCKCQTRFRHATNKEIEKILSAISRINRNWGPSTIRFLNQRFQLQTATGSSHSRPATRKLH